MSAHKKIEKHDIIKDGDIITPIKNKTQIHILFELFINGERSLSQLSKKLNISKSTVHRNLKNLLKLSLVHISKEKKVRGSIDAKYYKVKEDFMIWEKTRDKGDSMQIEEEKKDKIDIFSANIDMLNSIINIIKKPVELLKNFIDSGSDRLDMKGKDLYEIIKVLEPSISLMFLSEKQHQRATEILNAAQLELRELASQESKQKQHVARPHLFTSLLIDMNKLLELQPI